MCQTQSSLCPYHVIAEITHRMLVHAQADQWDEVTALAPDYKNAVEALQTLGALPREQLEARRQLMTRILENDAGIRRLASPELERLGLLISNLKRQRNVLKAYYAPQP